MEVNTKMEFAKAVISGEKEKLENLREWGGGVFKENPSMEISGGGGGG